MGESKVEVKEGILVRIAEAYRGINQNVWYVLFLAMVIIPMVYPLALPIGVSTATKDYKAGIDAAKDGGILLISVDYCTGGEGPGLPAAADTIKYAITRKHMKIVNIGFLMPVVGQLAENVFAQVPWTSYGYVYGTDYVNCGFYIGLEAGVAAIASDFQSVVKKDYRGKTLDQLPLLQQIHTDKDIALVVALSDYSSSMAYWARQWPDAPERPTVMCGLAADILPFYPGSVRGYLDTSGSGPAEFEVVSGIPGKAVIGSDIISMGQTFLLVVIILTNITYWIVRLQKKEVK